LKKTTVKHKIDELKEEILDPTRSRLFLRTSPPLRRRLHLMPGVVEKAVSDEDLKLVKQHGKRSYSRPS
jgi:hypothetical protein